MRSDAELIDAVLSGQREVFVDLVHRYEDTVHATTLAIVPDAQGHCPVAMAGQTKAL